MEFLHLSVYPRGYGVRLEISYATHAQVQILPATFSPSQHKIYLKFPNIDSFFFFASAADSPPEGQPDIVACYTVLSVRVGAAREGCGPFGVPT